MTISTISPPQTIQSTIGKYDTVKATFQADEMVSGKSIKVNIGLWLPSTLYGLASGPAYYGIVPASGTSTLLFANTPNWQNIEVKINAIDGKTFEIEVKYLNTADLNGYIGLVPQPNLANIFNKSYGSGTSVYDTSKAIGIYVDIENVTAEAKIQATNNYWCETDFTYITTGFQAMQDMVVKFQSTAPISQSYYVGFYREDTINNYEDVVDSLGLNYAFVNGGVMLVDMLPNTCITAATNIVSVGGISSGSVTIDKSCLEPNGTYRMYIVYKHLGQWHSCQSGPLKLQGATIPVIDPTVGYMVTDAFGNVYTDGCIKGLPAQGFIQVCTIIDRAALDAAITANGYSGDAEDYLQSIGVTIGGQTLPFVVDKSIIEICTNVNTDLFTGSNVVRFEVVMNYGDHTDVYNIDMPIEVVSNELTLTGTFTQDGNEVDEICAEDGDVTLTFSPLGGDIDALLGQDGYYGDDGIISESDGTVVVSNAFLNTDSEYCIRIIKQDPVSTGGCECPCPETSITIHEYTDAVGDLIVEVSGMGTVSGTLDGVSFTRPLPAIIYEFSDKLIISNIHVIDGDCEYDDITIRTYTQNKCYKYDIYNEDDTAHDATYRRCRGTQIDTVTVGAGEHVEVCAALGSVVLSVPLLMTDTLLGACVPVDNTVTVTLSTDDTYPCDDCDEDPLVCDSTPTIEYECDQETQTITASSGGSVSGAVTDVLEYSLTGTNYQSWGGSITGQAVVYLKRTITFDECPTIELNETVFCSMTEDCDNSLEIEYTLTPTLLTVTQTETINSPVHFDSGLLVSIDGGVTFNEYVGPITLVGGEEIVITRKIEFSDGCPTIDIIRTDVNDGAGTCDYEQFELFCEYNIATTLFSADFNGDESGLAVNDKKYSIDGGNTYSPYTGSVAGANMFLVVWEIQYPGCEKQTLIKACCKPSMLPTDEDGCLKVCIDGPVQVELPQQPIEVCLVECCEGFEPILECIDKMLSVTNAPAGATFAWTGPGGFTATTNPIDLTGQAEGTYYVSVTDTSTNPPCVSNGQYQFTMPNAGEPIADPIIII